MLQSACASHRPLSCHHALPVLLSSCRNWRYLPVNCVGFDTVHVVLAPALHTVLAWHMTACGSIIPVRSCSQQRCGVPCISTPHACRWELECLGCLVQCPTLAGQAASSSSSSHVRLLSQHTMASALQHSEFRQSSSVLNSACSGIRSKRTVLETHFSQSVRGIPCVHVCPMAHTSVS